MISYIPKLCCYDSIVYQLVLKSLGRVQIDSTLLDKATGIYNIHPNTERKIDIDR